jgi:hypothetical protein
MDTFDNIYDRGAGETLDRELSRTSVPQSIQIADRATMLRNLPALPSGIEMAAMAAAIVELERVRLAYAVARSAVNAAENRRAGARAEDASRGALAFRSGSDPVGPSAVQTLETEIVGLVARRDAGATAVAVCENELFSAIETNKAKYMALLGAAVEADRVAALAALDDFEASRQRLLSVLDFRSWLGGQRKWHNNLPTLRGIGAPPPAHADVVESLRRELTW